jgi:hypothetical protein
MSYSTLWLAFWGHAVAFTAGAALVAVLFAWMASHAERQLAQP